MIGNVVMQLTHSSSPGRFKAALLLTVSILVASGDLALGGAPAQFVSRGPGGGGAFFGPSINPFSQDELWIGSDMSDMFHSTDFGRTWDTVDFRLLGGGSLPGRMEFTSNPNRLYAAMVNSATGGIYRTVNLDAGVASTWTRLAVPPRTQGHPYNIVVLNDGTLVATYSARIATNAFQPSSGVFASTTDGASWVNRCAAGMQYYTKYLTVDPYDPAQATWYAGVWGEWGASAGLGGLYCTTNRGVNWTRITTNLKAVCSCTISPVNSDEMYVTTEDQGLWYSSNRRAAAPGQRIVLDASPDLHAWTPIGTNVMFPNQFTLGETSATAARYFRAEVR